jgi:2-dehydro-3-deoxy-D-arabinonate dehydratase
MAATNQTPRARSGADECERIETVRSNWHVLPMLLTRHHTPDGARWALDGELLAEDVSLGKLLAHRALDLEARLGALPRFGRAAGALLAPIDPDQEVWASGVTYQRSREAREAESNVANIYERVYSAERPELFFKSLGFRAVGHGQSVRIRPDSRWNVPEPELTLVVNAHLEIVGYCAGNDMSSRDIEGENPLYLPQAKIFDGSCAIGPGLEFVRAASLGDMPIALHIERAGNVVFTGSTSSARMKRALTELTSFLGHSLSFPRGVLLMTGTGIVPPEDFSLVSGDRVRIEVGGLVLENSVSS